MNFKYIWLFICTFTTLGKKKDAISNCFHWQQRTYDTRFCHRPIVLPYCNSMAFALLVGAQTRKAYEVVCSLVGQWWITREHAYVDPNTESLDTTAYSRPVWHKYKWQLHCFVPPNRRSWGKRQIVLYCLCFMPRCSRQQLDHILFRLGYYLWQRSRLVGGSSKPLML